MQYPSLRDYQNVIINQNNFHIPFFQSESMEIFLNPRGYPFMFVGGFGAIFKFRDKDKREYAFKVFTRNVPDRGERYKALHDALQKAQLPFMADFHYVPEGLRVKGAPYPAVVMEWGRGIQLDKAIEYDLADDGILQCAPFLAGELYFIVKTLQEHGMGHNDLQEGNILVRDDNKLVLIDYDGMFVPSLKNWPPCEMGLPHYQHPLRDKTHFNLKIDDFALISILYQLAVITPELWEKHHDDRRLLLKQADYENPGQSELIRFGLKSNESHKRALAELIVQACSLHPLEIQAIEKIEAVSEIMNWLAIPGEPVPKSQAESAIQWALALKTDDVTQFEKNRLSGPDSTAAEIKAVKPRKADAGRWKALREYLEAGKAMREKKTSDARKEKPVQAKTAPRPYARPISSGVKPAPQRPPASPVSPAPSKSSFGAELATFITLLFKLALSRIKPAIAIVILLVLIPCAYLFFKSEPSSIDSSPAKITHPRRSEPKTVSNDEYSVVFKLDKNNRPKQYVPMTSNRFQTIKNGQVIKDRATGLMWQQSGSLNSMNYPAARRYVEELNNNNFADYNDWRLPTTDELTSLLTKRKQKNRLYISPVFDKQQQWCWSSDKRAPEGAWNVYFHIGKVSWLNLDISNFYVRAVRSGQFVSSPSKVTHPQRPEPKTVSSKGSGSGVLIITPAKITHPQRSEPKTVSLNESMVVFKLDKNRRPKQYIPITPNRFQRITGRYFFVIKDRATGLMWEQSGKLYVIDYSKALQYVERLNRFNYAGYNDWRLPTIDELTSLLTKRRQKNGLYISSEFSRIQRWCWSSDKSAPAGAWYVSFYLGKVSWFNLGHVHYVRAVRSGP